MSNLYLNIYTETMDFVSGDFTPNIVKVKNYICSLNNFNNEKIEELRALIMRVKGDWISFKYAFFNETYYVDVYLIFRNKTLSVNQEEIVKNIILQCGEFLLKNKYGAIDININNSDKLSKLLEEDGFILSISENDGSGLLNNKEIEKVFNENDIKYEVLNIGKSSFDGGASGAAENLIYFIMSSAASGVTWDIMKPILTGNLALPIQSITMKVMDKYNFNKLRKIVADRIRVEERSLILTEMHKKNSKLNLEFRTSNKKIHITCDSNYNIIDFKVEED